MHANETFLHDMKPGLGQEVVYVRHPPEGRVFDGKHCQSRLPAAHRLDRVLEGAAGQRFQSRACFTAGLVRIGAGLTLESDASVHWPIVRLRARDRAFGRANYTLLPRRGSNRYPPKGINWK